MLRKSILLAPFVLLAGTAHAEAVSLPAPSRAELLYTTHCIACHNVEVHWRKQKLATDWAGLRAQVGRWQGTAGLGWDDDDIAQVAGYLNALHYRYPMPD